MTRMHWIWFGTLLTACTSSVNYEQAQLEEVTQARINLGLGYLEKNQWQLARKNLESAVALSPENVRARMSLAFYLQKVGEVVEAEQHYDQALKIAPSDPDLLNNYGTFLCHTNRYEQAQDAFLNAIVQKGYYKLSASYENAGLCAFKFDDKKNAKKWFTKAVDHEPNRFLSTLYLIELELKEKALSQARNRIEFFHEKYGYQAPSLLALIKLELEENQTKKAEKYARLLAEQFPNSQEYRQYLKNEL